MQHIKMLMNVQWSSFHSLYIAQEGTRMFDLTLQKFMHDFV